MSKLPRCVICAVTMTRIKGKPPLTCSRSVCRKKWIDKHGPYPGHVKSRWETPSAILSEVEMAEFKMPRD